MVDLFLTEELFSEIRHPYTKLLFAAGMDSWNVCNLGRSAGLIL